MSRLASKAGSIQKRKKKKQQTKRQKLGTVQTIQTAFKHKSFGTTKRQEFAGWVFTRI